MRLFHQIFLLVGLSAILAVLLMAGLVSLSLSRGFDVYLDDRDSQRFNEFIADAQAAIAAEPERGIEAAIALLPAPRPDRAPREIGRYERPESERDPNGSGPRSERPIKGRPPPPPDFMPRLAVYGPNGARLAGPPLPPDMPNVLRGTIGYADQALGEAVLLPRGPAPEGIETDFLRAQFSGIAALVALIILVAGLAAFLIARRGAAAIEDIEKVASNVANGDFSKRATVRGQGEIAKLASNINRMTSKLGELQQARQTWLAEVGHELRTPLTVIQGEIEVLREGIRPLNQEAITSLEEEANRLSLLVDDLQFLALSDMSRPQFTFAPVAIAPLIEATRRRFAPLAEAANHSLTIEQNLPSDLTATWDSARIEQLFANLISNAMAYTSAPGTIAVSATQAGSNVEINVEDSPPGVDQDDLGKLFDPLFRAEKSRARHLGGSGLGLAVCAVIASEHRGIIRASHSNLGGLRVQLVLPVNAESAAGGVPAR